MTHHVLRRLARAQSDSLPHLSTVMPPPPGLAFGEPDDRLQRGIQSDVALRFITDVGEYWIIRFRG
jgi:hypothetical protein